MTVRIVLKHFLFLPVIQFLGTSHLTDNLFNILLNSSFLPDILRFFEYVHDFYFLLSEFLLEPVKILESHFADGAQSSLLEADHILLLLKLRGLVEQLLEYVSVGMQGALHTVSDIAASVVEMPAQNATLVSQFSLQKDIKVH